MDPSMYREFAELHEARHWWFVGRRRILASFLRDHLGGRRDLRILDVGCGTGGMLPLLARHGNVTGIDPAPAAISYARQRYDGTAELLQVDFPRQLPPGGGFDLVTLFDVLEHLDDDAAALAAVSALLRPGGMTLVTVPALRSLWSPHDVINQHRRRYSRGELKERLEESGFRLQRLTYYNSLLFPAVYGARLLRRRLAKKGDRRSDFRIASDWLNNRLAALFGAERHLLKHCNLPLGVSLLALARKPGEPEPQSVEGAA
jgi:SAM-dependent methyltransferase